MDITVNLISFILANAFVSWIASLIFTGDTSKKDETSFIRPIANKKWKTFLIFFISYCILFFIMYLVNK